MSASMDPTDAPGYALAMRVLQSDLYAKLDDLERAECDALCRPTPTTAAQGEETREAGDLPSHMLAFTDEPMHRQRDDLARAVLAQNEEIRSLREEVTRLKTPPELPKGREWIVRGTGPMGVPSLKGPYIEPGDEFRVREVPIPESPTSGEGGR